MWFKITHYMIKDMLILLFIFENFFPVIYWNIQLFKPSHLDTVTYLFKKDHI